MAAPLLILLNIARLGHSTPLPANNNNNNNKGKYCYDLCRTTQASTY